MDYKDYHFFKIMLIYMMQIIMKIRLAASEFLKEFMIGKKNLNNFSSNSSFIFKKYV